MTPDSNPFKGFGWAIVLSVSFWAATYVIYRVVW